MKNKDMQILEETYQNIFEASMGKFSNDQILNMLKTGQITSQMYKSDESLAQQIEDVYYEYNKKMWSRVIPKIARELNRDPQELFNLINDAYLDGSYEAHDAIFDYEQDGRSMLPDANSIYSELKSGFESGLYENANTHNSMGRSQEYASATDDIMEIFAKIKLKSDMHAEIINWLMDVWSYSEDDIMSQLNVDPV